MKAAPRYYLDTSAHFERRGGSSATRDRLKDRLRGGGHATSTQAKREWNRIVFTTAVALRKALSARSEDWTDVVNAMSKGYGRTAARQMQVLHWITGSQVTDFGLVEKRLDDYQRIRFRAMFKAGISTVRDGTDCDVARRQPHRDGSNWRYLDQCKKTQDICDQPKFLTTQLARAKAAAAALEGSSRKADKKMGEKATAALNDPAENSTKGKACHAGNGLGGDICIALECAEDEILLTTDASFDLICPALGLKHERLVA